LGSGPGFGVGEQVPDDDEDGPADGAAGPGAVEAPGEAAEPLAEEGVGLRGAGGGRRLFGLSFSHQCRDGGRCGGRCDLLGLDLMTGAALSPARLDSGCDQVEVTPDQRAVLVLNSDNSLTAVDATTGSGLGIVCLIVGAVGLLSFAPSPSMSSAKCYGSVITPNRSRLGRELRGARIFRLGVQFMKGVVRSRAGGWGGARGWLVVSMALSVAVVVSSCSAVASFPGQLPNGNGLVTDVSSTQAFRDHGLRVPATAHGLRYEADSQGDGYPLHAYFSMPCSGVPAFLTGGSLSRDAKSYDEPSSGLKELAWYRAGMCRIRYRLPVTRQRR
jgi:hypothetical protein